MKNAAFRFQHKYHCPANFHQWNETPNWQFPTLANNQFTSTGDVPVAFCLPGRRGITVLSCSRRRKAQRQSSIHRNWQSYQRTVPATPQSTLSKFAATQCSSTKCTTMFILQLDFNGSWSSPWKRHPGLPISWNDDPPRYEMPEVHASSDVLPAFQRQVRIACSFSVDSSGPQVGTLHRPADDVPSWSLIACRQPAKSPLPLAAVDSPSRP